MALAASDKASSCPQAASSTAGYDQPGPCGAQQLDFSVTVPARRHGDRQRQLPVTVTLPMPPASSGNSDDALVPPFPLVFFFSGFKAQSKYYSEYARRLASWGFAVVQYDTPFFEIIQDADELPFLPSLRQWASREAACEGSKLYGQLDCARVGVAGHSRGGKLAALHFADDASIGAAVLLDPVDNTARTPESSAYPSACRALAKAARAVAVAGAGVTGPCSPEGTNFKKFFSFAPAGSWLLTICASGHAQLYDGGRVVNRLSDLLCHKGTNSRQLTISLALPPLVAWMDLQLRAGKGLQAVAGNGSRDVVGGKHAQGAQTPTGRGLECFMHWVKHEENAGQIQLAVNPQL